MRNDNFEFVQSDSFNSDPRSNPDVLPENINVKESEQHKRYRRLMDKAVATLDGRKSDVYQLYFKQGLTEHEISVKLIISQPAVSIYLRRAFEQIKAFCEINRKQAED